ncbi:MAG: hypothetical protein ABSA97_03835 [Verrucomicrobiia bacterium]
MDYRKYYHLETYLLGEVVDRFRDTGELSLFDFHCILIWKANRAKNMHVKRLQRVRGQTYPESVACLVSALMQSPTPKERLRVLMRDWGFSLPTATAILTILYPEDFTVYDARVCGQLRRFKEWASRRFTDRLWDAYLEFKNQVVRATPARYCLRDKDRYLWGKSFYNQVTDETRWADLQQRGLPVVLARQVRMKNNQTPPWRLPECCRETQARFISVERQPTVASILRRLSRVAS